MGQQVMNVILDTIELLYWRNIWLLLLVFLPFILFAIHKVQHNRLWHQIADDHLLPWLQINHSQNNPAQRNKTLPIILFLTTWVLLVIALAGPRLVDWVPPEQQANPATLVVIIDLSASMNATDAYPSRKAQAINWLAKTSHDKPDNLKLGIVVYAGHAFNLMPPTHDINVINHFIEQIKTISLPTLGNDLSHALTLANKQFSKSNSAQHILLLTDGDLSEQEQNKAAESFKQFNNKTITIIGFGHKTPVKIPTNEGAFFTEKGRAVQTRLASTWLKQMSSINHVTYHPFDAVKDSTLKHTIKLKNSRITPKDQQSVIWNELFPYPLVLAIIFFIISLKISNRTFVSSLLSLSVIFLLSTTTQEVEANQTDLFKQATSALNKNQFKKAEVIFKQIDSVPAAFGEGIACYRQADFHCATTAFSKAAWQTSSTKIRANAVFNLANSYFYLGQYDQASVLYADAKHLGFNPKIAEKNLDFSNTMQQAVLKRVNEIKEIFRRAKWRASLAGDRPPLLEDIISQQNNLTLSKDKSPQTFILRSAFAEQVQKQLGIKIDTQIGNQATQWIKTERVAPESTAQLLKRLFEMELDIPAPLKQPQVIEGKRTW